MANVLHCENPLKIEDEWITEYNLEQGEFDVTEIDERLETKIPTETQMGKVYTRLIINTLKPKEAETYASCSLFGFEKQYKFIGKQ